MGNINIEAEILSNFFWSLDRNLRLLERNIFIQIPLFLNQIGYNFVKNIKLLQPEKFFWLKKFLTMHSVNPSPNFFPLFRFFHWELENHKECPASLFKQHLKKSNIGLEIFKKL